MEAGIAENGVVIVKFVAPLKVTSEQPTFVSDSLSLKRYTSNNKAQRWVIQTNLEPSNNSADFLVHSVVNGYDNSFSIKMPQVYRKAIANAATSGTVSATAPAGAFSIPVTLAGTKIIQKGEFIQFGDDDKVYLVKENLVGSGNLQIFPALTKQALINSLVKLGASVFMKARYETDTILGIQYTDGILSDPGTVTFIEALV